MSRFPALDIRFPAAREAELHEQMKQRAKPPWAPQDHDAMGRPVQDGSFYFHRDTVDDAPSCTVCIHRSKPGHWVVANIVPDKGQTSQIPLDQYKAILAEFDTTIADPVAESLEGMTAMEISQYRLEDYFSTKAVGLLHSFCNSPNPGSLGGHPSDQERWVAFLLCAYDDGGEVHCDVFGRCLKNSGWWPEEYIPKLAHEYDFAMRVLEQSGR